MPDYVLVSAARNEEQLIGRTIDSIARQTILPREWVIVDDGSTDATANIVRERSQKLPWLKLVVRGRPKGRSFSSQYAAVMEGYSALQDRASAFVGKLDTDLVVESENHYQEVFAAMERNTRLGITGGWVHEDYGAGFEPRRGNESRSVPGGVQTFRRACFAQVDGYEPLPYGGSDWLAEVKARSFGWEVYALEHLPVLHCRHTGGFDGAIRSAWRWGKRDASFGTILPFCLLKCLKRLRMPPVLGGSLVWFAGYLSFRLRGEPVAIPRESCHYLRQEQWARLRGLFKLGAVQGAEGSTAS